MSGALGFVKKIVLVSQEHEASNFHPIIMSSPPPRNNQDKMPHSGRQNSTPTRSLLPSPIKPNNQQTPKSKGAAGPSGHHSVMNGSVPKANGKVAIHPASAVVPSSSSQSPALVAGRGLFSSSNPSTSSSATKMMIADVNNVVPVVDKQKDYIDQPQDESHSTEEEEEDVLEEVHISELPEGVLENLFTFLDLEDVVNASLVCLLWHDVFSDENGEIWRNLCLRNMDKETLSSDTLSACPTFKSKLRAFYHAWNSNDCSRNIVVKPNGFTIHRNPVAQSTDGARGKIGFNRGRHAWEVKWEGPLGTVAVVGVATQHAELRAQGYIALLGRDDQSWGWNLVENILLHNGDSHGNYPLVNNAPRYQVGERIRVILDCEDNTLSFEKNEEFLGVAFRGLPQTEALFPSVSAVYGNSEISMVYLGPPLDG